MASKIDVELILSDPDNYQVKTYCEKKCEEFTFLNAKTAKLWVLVVLRTWSGLSIWKEIKTNQRKMEVVYKYWKQHFFGFGVYVAPDKTVVNCKHFRKGAKDALEAFNNKASVSREKYTSTQPKVESPTEKSSKSPVETYFNVEVAKLSNERTKKRRPVYNPYLKKKNPPNKPQRPPAWKKAHPQAARVSFDMPPARNTEEWVLPTPDSSMEEY